MMNKLRNKELSWLSFNDRVLQEADNPDVPVLERLKFLGIYSNNLDEFFRVRVATLLHLSQLAKRVKSYLNEEPDIVISQVNNIVALQQEKFRNIYKNVLKGLEKNDIYIINETELTTGQEKFLCRYFEKYVRPNLDPVIIGKDTDISDLINDSVYLVIDLRNEESPTTTKAALVRVPADKISRFVKLPSVSNKEYIILLDDVIRLGISLVFDVFGYSIAGAYTIKITRNAELDIDDDLSKSYVEKISRSLKKRKSGYPVRFLYDRDMPESLLKIIKKKLNLIKPDSIFPGGRYHNFKDFMDFPDVGRSELKYEKWPSINHMHLLRGKSFLSQIRKTDILLHFPYHSFANVVKLVREAALDPKVVSIKMTIYRVAHNSGVMISLINAAKNGKQVTAVMELQARFNEELNIYWAKKLVSSGVKVIYGVPGLKVHSKLLFIQKQEDKRIVNYAGIGTGNFNESTAKTFSDTLLLTSHKGITSEVEQVFRFFDKNYEIGNFKHLIISPFNSRKKIVRLINSEIRHAKQGKKAEIIFKLNNLVDHRMILKLYEAYKAGVIIKLIVRGMFSLIPSIPEQNINIESIGVIDRYLEHSRFLYFYAGGKEKIFLTSSDLMERNLDRRVEVACPVYDSELKKEIKDILNIQWKDNTQARILDNELSNKYRRNSEPDFRSQYETYKYLFEKSNTED